MMRRIILAAFATAFCILFLGVAWKWIVAQSIARLVIAGALPLDFAADVLAPILVALPGMTIAFVILGLLIAVCLKKIRSEGGFSL